MSHSSEQTEALEDQTMRLTDLLHDLASRPRSRMTVEIMTKLHRRLGKLLLEPVEEDEADNAEAVHEAPLGHLWRGALGA